MEFVRSIKRHLLFHVLSGREIPFWWQCPQSSQTILLMNILMWIWPFFQKHPVIVNRVKRNIWMITENKIKTESDVSHLFLKEARKIQAWRHSNQLKCVDVSVYISMVINLRRLQTKKQKTKILYFSLQNKIRSIYTFMQPLWLRRLHHRCWNLHRHHLG